MSRFTRSMSPRNNLFDLMMIFPRKINIVSRGLISKYMGETRLKPNHMMIIYEIGRQNGISQKELCTDIPFDKSYISTAVRELIDMGFVINESEGKTYKLSLTDSGKDIRAMALMMFDILEGRILDVLDTEDREQMTRIMTKLDAHMDKLLEEFK